MDNENSFCEITELETEINVEKKLLLDLISQTLETGEQWKKDYVINFVTKIRPIHYMLDGFDKIFSQTLDLATHEQLISLRILLSTPDELKKQWDEKTEQTYALCNDILSSLNIDKSILFKFLIDVLEEHFVKRETIIYMNPRELFIYVLTLKSTKSKEKLFKILSKMIRNNRLEVPNY